MRGIKPSVFLAAVAVVGLAVWAGASADKVGGEMTTAAGRYVAALDDEQKAKGVFDFDSPERTNWHFIPRPRKGLPIKEMTSAQRALAFGLLRTGVGADGFLKATTIMSLEAILKELEQGRGPVRDPELYYVSIFGKPSEGGKWGWRIEGHHLSLNFLIEDGKIVSATPAFFGSNPGEVRQGPRKGLRTLGDLEDRALRLLQSLDDDQKKVAVVAEKAPPEIKSGGMKGETGGLSARGPDDAPEGIAYRKLSDSQRMMLKTLLESYAHEMPPEVAVAWLNEIQQAGPDAIHFAWMGPGDRSQGHAYKVQGPTFLIEFNNTQNGANHIHSLWRNRLGDFGLASK
ncbi:MAG TPA: DUF3500 domain-containing protein [Isosphaeraceae bacterium]|jgi:hypothetical protein|nr:DUF3500 domain-containing protein [Isosphaeraceae bacterium]